MVLAAVVILAIAGGVYALTRSSDNNASTPQSLAGVKVGVPQVVSPAKLMSFARAASGPIYWAGAPGAATSIELTDTTSGNVYIRYLTGAAAAGDPRPAFTTIGTYGLTNAYGVVYADGKAKGATRVHVPGGGIAVTTLKAPDSVYVAFPHTNYVAEVYATSPVHALRIVLSGKILPVAPGHR
jgi:hypothetical protein